MTTDASYLTSLRRGAPIRAALLSAVLALGGCGGSALDPNTPITELDQIAACWTDFDDPLKQVRCFSRGTDVVTTALRELVIESRARGEDPQER